MSKKVRQFILFFFLAVICYGCVNFFKLSDLRTDAYSFPNNQAKAKQLMEEMGKAHRIDMWDSIETYEVLFEEESFGFLGKKSSPFKELKMKFSLNYIPHTFTGQLEILSGEEKGTIWGVHDGQTYQRASGTASLQENKEMNFTIPTYQYFIEFPSRIQEASVIDYIGEQTIDGIKTEGIIASWDTVAPQKNTDQYVIWINADSKQIVKIDYTIRDKFRFVAGSAYYKGYRAVNGFILPTEISSKSNLQKKGFLHIKKILDFTPNQVSVDFLTAIH